MDLEAVSSTNAADAADIARLVGQLTGREELLAPVAKQVGKLIGRDDRLLLVARQNGAIVGMAVGYLCPHISPRFSPFLLVEGLAVEKSCRRQGIGRAMMQYMEEWAAGHSARYITLASQSARAEAHQFYASLGYDRDVAFQKFLFD